MMAFEDVQIQLIEAPALFKGASKGDGWGAKVLGLARNADSLVIIVDLTASNPLSQLETIIDEVAKIHITIEDKKRRIEVEKKEVGGIQVVAFSKIDIPIYEVKDLLRNMRINHAVVKIWGAVDLEDITQALLSTTLFKPTLVIANKFDTNGAEEKLRSLESAFSYLDILATSMITMKGVDVIPRRIFASLNIIRVYTKRPKRSPAKKPIIMKSGATVGDAAKLIHKTFYKDFKYARIWGSSMYPGKRVGISYILKDKDIIEIRI